MSRIGNQSIPIPSGVEISVKAGSVSVKGPKGNLSRVIPEGTTVSPHVVSFIRPELHGEDPLPTREGERLRDPLQERRGPDAGIDHDAKIRVDLVDVPTQLAALPAPYQRGEAEASAYGCSLKRRAAWYQL